MQPIISCRFISILLLPSSIELVEARHRKPTLFLPSSLPLLSLVLTAIDVLVHGNAFDHSHEEDDIRGRDAAAAGTQTLPTDMGDDAQNQKRNGATR